MSDAEYTAEPEVEASVGFVGRGVAHHRAVHESPRKARLRAVPVAEARRDVAEALSSPADCLPANNHVERWSAIPDENRQAVKRSLACFAQPALLAASGGPAPFQEAVRTLGAAHAQLARATLHTLAGYLEFGGWLLTLSRRAPKGLWLRAFRDSKDPLAETLPISRQQAEAFMRFAQEPAIVNPANWEHLPPGWTVLDAVLRATRRSDQPLKALIDNRTIHPGMTRREAQALHATALDKHLDAGRARRRASFEALLEKVRRYVFALDPARLWMSAPDAVALDKSLGELSRLLREKADELEAARSLNGLNQ
jgi:hypothetical protein